jgi:hypothetical protein
LCHSADTKAAEAVTAAAKGQGYILSRFSQAVESCSDQNQAKILYCMKDVSLEEVSCMSSIIMDQSVSIETDVNIHDIHDLAVQFTTLLQQSNPGGVSNIMSSIGKLNVPDQDVPLCPLCMEPLHPHERQILARDGIFLDSLCDSCKIGIFGSSSNDTMAGSEYAQDVFGKLPVCIQNEIMGQH